MPELGPKPLATSGGGPGPSSAHRVGPVGVIGLLPQRALQVKVLRVVGGLSPRIADVALCVEPLSSLHGMLWPHACKRQEAQLALNASDGLSTGVGTQAYPKADKACWVGVGG